MMSFKQQEVLEQIVQTMKTKHPEFEITDVTEIHANSYWISHTLPSDEDEEFKARDLLAELATDVLVDYGFFFQFVEADPEVIEEVAV